MPTELKGEGVALASGTGRLTTPAWLLPDAAVAIGVGEGTLTLRYRLHGEGGAVCYGAGLLTYTVSPPKVSATLADLWFYGATRVRSMPGVGTARASGTGVLTT